MNQREGIVAVGLLTERDLAVLGEGFRRAYRLNEGHDFDDLLTAIDKAERDYIDRGEIRSGPTGKPVASRA